jgi:DNA-binding protein YbaB
VKRDRSSLEKLRVMQDELSGALKRLESRAQASAEAFRQADELDRELERTRFRYPIEPGLGEVTIVGTGELVQIEFDLENLKTTDVAKLGARVVQAIQGAEKLVLEKRAAERERIFQYL